MSLTEIIGINLKYYRYKEGLSQEKYYAKYGLSPKYMANVERGLENVTADKIDELAFSLGLSSSDLVTFDESHIITQKRVDAREKIKS